MKAGKNHGPKRPGSNLYQRGVRAAFKDAVSGRKDSRIWKDELGSPLRYTDTEGRVVESYSFDEFGNDLRKEQEKIQPLGYAGFYEDTVSGTYFAQAREYDSKTGRFTARDMVQGVKPYTLNEYGYCWNRPTVFVDHDGAFPSWEDIQQEVSDWADAAGEWVGDTVNSAGEALSDAATAFFDGADYIWQNCVPQEVQSVIGDIGNAVGDLGRGLIEVEIMGVSISDVMAAATQSWPGEVFLDMVCFDRTSDGVYHADQNCWQAPFGYNDFYDYVFDAATSMNKEKYPFTTADGTNYTIWMWKGDYLNLGAGCETGIYYGDGYHVNSATDTNLHMTLSLYDKESGKLIFTYNPQDPQWWITGFNPKYQDMDYHDLEVQGSINFSENPELWDAFYNEYKKESGWCFEEEHYIAYYRW